MEHIVLIGAPGSGKSSVAKDFVARADGAYEYISSGQIARELAEVDDLTHEALYRGDYAPEPAMRAEITMRIESAIFNGKCVIIEGFPRMLAQVVVLEEALKKVPTYIQLDCPFYMCLRRAIMRGRPHDKPDAIATRFEAYERDTKPILALLQDGADFYPVPNTQPRVSAATAMIRQLVGLPEIT